jgi:hypothetical protein
MDQQRAERILADRSKRIRQPLRWAKVKNRAVAEFEVAVDNDLGEPLCFAGQYVPEAGIFKLQLLGEGRVPLYRFESNKEHHNRDCTRIVGPHTNRFTDAEHNLAEPETVISATDIRAAIGQFAERVGIQRLPPVPLPPGTALQLTMLHKGGERSEHRARSGSVD